MQLNIGEAIQEALRRTALSGQRHCVVRVANGLFAVRLLSLAEGHPALTVHPRIDDNALESKSQDVALHFVDTRR